MNLLRRLFQGHSPLKPQVPLEELQKARPGIERWVWLETKAAKAKLALRATTTLQAVEAFESAAGIRLPDDYVFFITRVGNGGSAPCRLQSLEDWDAGHWSAVELGRDLAAPCLITPELEALGENWLWALGVENASEKWDRDEWDPMRGMLALADYGCGLFYRLIVNGPHRGRVFLWGDHAKNSPVFQPQPDFASWIGFYLDLAAEGKPVHFLNGRTR